MMDNLADLAAVLRSLDADKITDRKKGADNLRSLLSKSSVANALTQHSEERHRGTKAHLTWDGVLKAVIAYVHIETEALQKAKENVSATTLANRDKKKHEVSALFKFVVRTAEKYGGRLKSSLLLSHILDVIKGDYTCMAFGTDYSSILLKNVLSVRRYWIEIPDKTWDELLERYCQLFLDTQSGVDRAIVAQLVKVIMKEAALQCDLQRKKFLSFYSKVFKNIKEYKGMVILEHMVVSLNTFVKAIAPNSRVQICKLGETILSGLLYLWDNYPSDALKDDIIVFVKLQMEAHHPCGAKTPETGAYAVDWDVWKDHLSKLYDMIKADIDHLGGRQKFASGTRNVVMKDLYIELAADICHQLFTEARDRCTVTTPEEDSAGAPAKKRRLMSGWSSLLDTVSSKANTPQLIPWLQLVGCVLEKHPGCLVLMDGVDVLHSLHQVLVSCKKSEIYKHILTCLASLAWSVGWAELPQGTRDAMVPLWLQVWTTCLSVISSRQAESDGYQEHGFELLTAMLHNALVTPGRHVWNLFLPDVARPTPSSLTFLTHLLATRHILENYLPSILGSGFSADKGTFPLRRHLLMWVTQGLTLLPSGVKKPVKLSAEKLVRLLVQLVLRDPAHQSEGQVRRRDFSTSLERLYLLTTFDCELDFEKVQKDSGKTAVEEGCHVIPVLVTYLGECLQTVVQSHLELTESQIGILELLAYDCSLLSHCRVTTQQQQIPLVGLEPLLKQVLKKLTSVLTEYVKEGTTGLVPVMECLKSMVTFGDPSDLVCYATAEVIRSCVPLKLTELLLELVNKKLSRSSSNTRTSRSDVGSLPRLHRAGSGRSVSRVMDDFDDFDSFENMPSTSKEAFGGEEDMEMGFDDMHDGGDSQEGAEGPQHNTAGSSLLDPLSLSDTQSLRNAIVTFLCLLTGYDRHCAPGEVTPSSFDVMAVKSKTQDVLREEKFDLTRAADMQMMRQMCEVLLSVDHHVTDPDLENIMGVLSRVVRVHRHDQELCCLVLSLLALVCPHLADPDDLPSQSRLDFREMLLHWISAFWRLQSDYNSQVRLSLAKCMAVITQHDPEGQWGPLNLKRQDEGSEEEGPKPTVATKFPHCLIDECLVVRLYMASSMNKLFMSEVGGKLVPKSKEQQHAVFDHVYEICSVMMDVQGRERGNRMASLLLVLSTAAMTSPVCEKKALFALCLAIQDKNVDVLLVSKILKKMSAALGYQATSTYLCNHLPYLVNEWLKMDYALDTFPYTLLECDGRHSFYSGHYKTLAPLLVVQGSTDALSSLAEELEMSVQDVLMSSLPAILVHILPVFAVSKMSTSSGSVSAIQRRLTNATACYDSLVEQLSKETIERSIVNQLGNIVVSTLGCLALDRERHSQEGTCDPEPNPPSYSEDVVRATLDYLTQSFSGSTRSLVAVLAKTPDGLEQVLLELCLMLWREQRVHERLRCLQMFSLFVTMMLQELAATQLGGAWAFVLRRVVTTLLQLLRPLCGMEMVAEPFGYQEDIVLVGLNLMKQVCTAIIECCYQELDKYLGSVVDVVSQLGRQGGEVGDTATQLLRHLLVEKVDVVHSAIVSLDPLPQHPSFATLAKHCDRIQRKAGHNSFSKLVDQVMNVSKNASQPPQSFARTLQLLTQAIDADGQQFTNMMSDSQGSKRASQVICELLRLTQSPMTVVAGEAGRCLGAIGPLCLKTASLPRPQLSSGLSLALSVYEGSPSEKYCYVFHSLHQYLVDPSMEVVQTVSVTLKKLLATTAGVQFSTDYKDKLANRDYLFQYLHPFRASRHSKTPPSSGKDGSLQQFHDQLSSQMVWEGEDGDHAGWIRALCVALLQSGAVADSILSLLQPVCLLKTEFCEMLLPYLVHEILSGEVAEHKTLLSQRIAGFFRTHCDLSASNSARLTPEKQPKSVCMNKESVLAMLRVVTYLRTQKRPEKRPKHIVTAWDNNFWLDLDYLDVAWAAHNCAAHFSALLFAEIWWDAHRQSDQSTQNSGHSESSSSTPSSQTSTAFSESSSDDRGGLQTLLREALRCIGDPDAVYGCGVGSLPDPASRVETYLHEKQWEKAVVTLDIQMQQPSPSTQLQLLKAVQRCGGDYLLGVCLQGFEDSPQADITELQYAAAWKAGQWDLDVPSISESSAPFHQSLYSCLHAVRDDQPSMALRILDHSRQNLLRTFDVNMESCRSVYPLLSQLQCLRQFERLTSAFARGKKSEELGSLLHNWQKEETHTERGDFEFLEPVYSLRVAAVRLLSSCKAHPDAQTTLQNVLLHTAKTARMAGFYQMSERCLHEVQHQTDMSPATSVQAQLQLAQLFWARSEQMTAKHVLKSLIKRCQGEGEENGEAMRLLTKSLSLYGNWLAETRSETPSVIMEQYLEKTVQLLESSQNSSGPEAVDGYFSLARFADTQYQNIVDYMNSPTFEAKQALMNKAAAEYEKYTVLEENKKDRYLRTLEKQSKIDKQEVAAMTEDRKRFLHHAVRCYASCLQHGDTHDLRIFRLTSLWFDNSASPEVNEVLEECAQKLKSYKFLPLLHQLAARMSSKVKDNQLFMPTLNMILGQAATDHPHHTLWVLLALAHANKDEEIISQGQSAKRRGKLATGRKSSEETEDRVQAAQALLEELKRNSKVANIVRDMEMLSTAYVELANWSVEQHRRETRPVPLPRTLKIMSVKDLTSVAVPSLEMKVDPSCSYDNIVSVVGYQSTFRLCGGVNLPKIIACRCSDGVERRQLVKGRDDLRQDAIMQQAFSLVNRLLSDNPATSSRQLNIRTYKVVPLSRRSGLLEWCEGTQPIGEYLLGQSGVRGSGAHSRYRPKDWSFLDCRKTMSSVASVSDPETKYKAYMEACKNFQPVFRFFFMENFPDPAHWFQCRLAYTRSVATNSIVGYILGLGDRHVMNILIDRRSAELIHIDLGIAFEQGHILPTPETVPFRLTRDIVDGMGVTGVEGVFRRCCEKTMEVMRAHQESLMTIVQVLLYDPLSDWTLSPQRAYAVQGRHDRRDCDTTDMNVSMATNADTELCEDGDKTGEVKEPVNKLAERVLLRLRQKLQGLEDGVALSVAGQVNHLIQIARDPHCLSRLFPGWQPYI
ncbi:serine-protein kinase ATM-like [Babylonia areolata]|uniref:serine-protein kinase ATM-like n=1 Tax=Babylonia areolata TaxID=304850 RepID=UPI003FD29FA1